MLPKDAEKLIKEVLEGLGEQFEAVQIMATWMEEGRSMTAKVGSGNFYARKGMAHEFIQEDISKDLAFEIANIPGFGPRDDY